jgi:hypothetical protein
MFWERIVSGTAGTITFVYWSNTSDEGILAKAPSALVAQDLKREREAAALKTRDWPIPVCGNDSLPRIEPPKSNAQPTDAPAKK